VNTAQRLNEIRRRLDAAFQPVVLDVTDEGRHHVGHEGAKDGRGHFRVHIVAAAFAGRSPIQRHRLIYQALGGLMQSDVHALAIDARAPDEA